MMGRDSDVERFGVSRRTFVRGIGVAAGSGLLGVGTATANEASGFDPAFANWRVREAQKVWNRGITGRRDRTVALTDSGIEARHPDLGPWNGITAIDTPDGIVLTTADQLEDRSRTKVGDHGPFTGVATPGVFVESATDQVVTEFTPAEVLGSVDADTSYALSAALSWSPYADNSNDLELRLDRRVDGEWQPVETAATADPTEELVDVPIDPSSRYRYVLEKWLHSASEYEVTGTFVELDPIDTVDEAAVFDDLSNKVFGWYDAGARYGTHHEPSDGNGHGTHVSSIMAGTGQASAVNPNTLIQEAPGLQLTSGQSKTYTVAVGADEAVFAGAYGTGISVVIRGPDGTQLERTGIDKDHSLNDNVLVDHPAVHDQGTKPYTITIRPYEDGQFPVATLERVAVGALLPSAAAGDGSSDGDVTLHAGLAPNAGLVGLQGLSAPTEDLGKFAADVATTFNVRAVNMSWGYAFGLPFGQFGGLTTDLGTSMKRVAEGGMLPIAAAGNAFTPANGNGMPAVADEAVSVAATDPVDGLTVYSAGGIAAVDEDDGGVYRKPEVSAPGGAGDGYPAIDMWDTVRAAKNGDPEKTEAEQGGIRDYVNHAGTSMASPYVTGTAALVAEAMEFEAPEEIRLPTPKALHADGVSASDRLDHVMRFKQVLLATASETAFTAAPFHHPSHRPTYDFGERDPYEGYGRVNPDAAVDAVSRDLLPGTIGTKGGETTERTHSEAVGLDVPADSRAVAGYVQAKGGTVDVSVTFSEYTGADVGRTTANPHLDLFVYDAEQPGPNGEPNVVARRQAPLGSGTVSVDVPAADSIRDYPNKDVYYVVVKLVNVPGAHNTHDVQATFDLTVSFSADGRPSPAGQAATDAESADDGGLL